MLMIKIDRREIIIQIYKIILVIQTIAKHCQWHTFPGSSKYPVIPVLMLQAMT